MFEVEKNYKELFQIMQLKKMLATSCKDSTMEYTGLYAHPHTLIQYFILCIQHVLSTQKRELYINKK